MYTVQLWVVHHVKALLFSFELIRRALYTLPQADWDMQIESRRRTNDWKLQLHLSFQFEGIAFPYAIILNSVIPNLAISPSARYKGGIFHNFSTICFVVCFFFILVSIILFCYCFFSWCCYSSISTYISFTQ